MRPTLGTHLLSFWTSKVLRSALAKALQHIPEVLAYGTMSLRCPDQCGLLVLTGLLQEGTPLRGF